jgi:hypothetical protein
MSSSNAFGDAGQWQAPAATPHLNYDLRPLSTGEVLDRTFQIYRSLRGSHCFRPRWAWL